MGIQGTDFLGNLDEMSWGQTLRDTAEGTQMRMLFQPGGDLSPFRVAQMWGQLLESSDSDWQGLQGTQGQGDPDEGDPHLGSQSCVECQSAGSGLGAHGSGQRCIWLGTPCMAGGHRLSDGLSPGVRVTQTCGMDTGGPAFRDRVEGMDPGDRASG